MFEEVLLEAASLESFDLGGPVLVVLGRDRPRAPLALRGEGRVSSSQRWRTRLRALKVALTCLRDLCGACIQRSEGLLPGSQAGALYIGHPLHVFGVNHNVEALHDVPGLEIGAVEDEVLASFHVRQSYGEARLAPLWDNPLKAEYVAPKKPRYRIPKLKR